MAREGSGVPHSKHRRNLRLSALRLRVGGDAWERKYVSQRALAALMLLYSERLLAGPTDESEKHCRNHLVLPRSPLRSRSVLIPSAPPVHLDRQFDLAVDEVVMRSAGWVSLEGVAAIIREIRLMVRDISYRNSQAKAKGELEIEQARLAVAKQRTEFEITDPKLAYSRAVAAIATNLLILRQLEASGKLRDLGESVDQERPPRGEPQ